MAGQYQRRQFLRRAPNALLAEYFTAREFFFNIKVRALKETDIEPVFAGIASLPQSDQADIDRDFQKINSMASPAGIEALCNEAVFCKQPELVQQVAAIDGLHAKAMWMFLNAPEYWRAASSIMHAETASSRYWRKRTDLPTVLPDVSEEALGALAQGISAYFHEKEGRGRNCRVEPYRKVDTGKEYFFAYPEDYGQTDVEWEQEQFLIRPRHPAFEIIFVYCASEGSLDIYAPRNAKAIPELQRVFARTILHLETLSDGAIDKRVYDLDGLADPAFTFRWSESANIDSVQVSLLRLTLKARPKCRIILEADPFDDPRSVYRLLEELNPPAFFITQVRFKVVFTSGAESRRARTRSFSVTYPNSCSLNHDGQDQIIRQMLIDSDIEPRPPSIDEPT